MAWDVGLLCVQAGQRQVLHALDQRRPRLVLGERRGQLAQLEVGRLPAAWRLAISETMGQTFILDPARILSADPDLVVDLSAELQDVVVGCGAETERGLYWFYAAKQGYLLRGYCNCYLDMRSPWSVRAPLKCESRLPLEDLDARGIQEAVFAMGFDLVPWAHMQDHADLYWFPGGHGYLRIEEAGRRRQVALEAAGAALRLTGRATGGPPYREDDPDHPVNVALREAQAEVLAAEEAGRAWMDADPATLAPEPGPWGAELAGFRRSVEIPGWQRPQPFRVERGGRVEFTVKVPVAPRRGLLDRIRRG